MSTQAGVLYIVATPIGNLGDMTQRAREVLGSVKLIACEDTRNSRKLLSHFSIDTPMLALHEHNEQKQGQEIIKRLQNGDSIALISDAGTPLISDPGYILVSEAQQQGIQVVPVPGASALISALSVAGLPTDRFCFEGFLPAKASAREKQLIGLKKETRTLVFYEAPHRIAASLESIANVFGDDRIVVLLRELTKLFETVKRAPAGELRDWVAQNPEQQKGECVVIVAGARNADDDSGRVSIEIDTLLLALIEKMSIKDAAQLAAELTGQSKNQLYDRALKLRDERTQQNGRR